jgi:hypothetical protein
MKRSVTKKEDREALLIRATNITIDHRGQPIPLFSKAKSPDSAVADAQVYDELEDSFEKVREASPGREAFDGIEGMFDKSMNIPSSVMQHAHCSRAARSDLQ